MQKQLTSQEVSSPGWAEAFSGLHYLHWQGLHVTGAEACTHWHLNGSFLIWIWIPSLVPSNQPRNRAADRLQVNVRELVTTRICCVWSSSICSDGVCLEIFCTFLPTAQTCFFTELRKAISSLLSEVLQSLHTYLCQECVSATRCSVQDALGIFKDHRTLFCATIFAHSQLHKSGWRVAAQSVPLTSLFLPDLHLGEIF